MPIQRLQPTSEPRRSPSTRFDHVLLTDAGSGARPDARLAAAAGSTIGIDGSAGQPMPALWLVKRSCSSTRTVVGVPEIPHFSLTSCQTSTRTITSSGRCASPTATFLPSTSPRLTSTGEPTIQPSFHRQDPRPRFAYKYDTVHTSD